MMTKLQITFSMAIAFFLLLTSSSIAGVLNDYNPTNINIPDNGASVNSDLRLSGAPSGAKITKVKVYYEIRHANPGNLDVWLTTYYNNSWHDHWLYHQGDLGSTDNIIETRDNIHTWDGASPNQTWYISVRDRVSGDVGYIDFFELWVTYEVNEAPNTPSNPDPTNGATNVSRTTDFYWSCSDPNGDTIYYTVYFEKNDSSPDNIIKNDSTGSYVDPGTLDYDSHYYWSVKADDYNGGVTLSPVWDFYTEAEPIVDAEIMGVSFDRTEVKRGQDTITATVSIHNTGNQNWTFYVGCSSIKQGNSTWYDWSPSRADKTLSPGQTGSVTVSWSPSVSVPTGTFGFFSKIFNYSSVAEYVDDDWRDAAFQVVDPVVIDAEITSVTFDQTQVARGQQTITATVSVQNTGNQSWTVYIGGSSIKQSDTTWFDWTPSRASKTLSPGQTENVNLSWSPSAAVPTGTYGFFSKVFKYSTGDEFLDDDWRDAAFQVVEAVLLSSGRIAFHRDSDNHTLHAPINGDDGNIFIYSLNSALVTKKTGGLSIGNCMNPHFSPNGAALTFMAIPSGQSLTWANMHVYVLDLAEGTLTNLGTGQDPKFSPDGQKIIYKKNEQIWLMNRDGSSDQALTTSTGEKSGPNYSLIIGDQRIVYWKTYWVGASKRGDIVLRLSNGTEQTLVYGTDSWYCYYPIWRDSNLILYTVSEGGDDLYQFNISTSSNVTLPSPINSSSDDSDPFPANDLIGFSSSRTESFGGGYDLYIAKADGSSVQELVQANTSLHELGGYFSPYRYARKLKVNAPSDGMNIEQGATYVLKVRTYSDGAIWSGANPSVTLAGPVTLTYTGLKDEGTDGDQTAGDGIYSKTVTLPSTSGDFSVTANALSSDNGLQNNIMSEIVNLSLYYNQQTGSLLVTISPQGAIDAGAQWRRVGTSTWRNSGDIETDIPVGHCIVEFKDITITGWEKPLNKEDLIINNGLMSTVSGVYTQNVAVNEVPTMFKVWPPFPNPFNPATTIRYEIPSECHVSFIVYDINGRRVAVLEEGIRPAGIYNAVWDGKDNNGILTASGVYLYRLEAGANINTGKILFLR